MAPGETVFGTMETPKQGRLSYASYGTFWAPLNQEFGEAIGADAYCRDAAVAADTAKQLVAERRAAG